MSRAEAQVAIHRLRDVIEALRDLASDAPPHVAMDQARHIEALEDARRELARIHGISV